MIMNKKTVGGLVILVGLVIIIGLLLWRIHSGISPHPGPGAGTATAPAPVPPAPATVTPTPTPAPGAPPAPGAKVPPAAPLGSKPGSLKGTAPGGEVSPPAPNIITFPPSKPEAQYGFLKNTYRRYRDADRMVKRLRKQGKTAFMRRKNGRFQVWVGPFASPEEAEAAAKSLRGRHQKIPKIERIENPIPK
jgi:cell division septation protein DedD